MTFLMLKNSSYLVAMILFVVGIKKLSSPETAGRGNLLSAIGMLIAVIVTLLEQTILGVQGILIGLIVGSIIGVCTARWIAMTAMPEMVALLNGVGGGASVLLAWGFYSVAPVIGIFEAIVVVLSVVIGGITFSGSIIAWGKLAEKLPGRPLQFFGQQYVNLLIVVIMIMTAYLFVVNPGNSLHLFYGIMGISIVLGVLSVLAIGGGDMPVVIALLNSYSGLAASAAGFVIGNLLLIVVGLLVGASGIILTIIMCKAMNRTLRNVLFAGFGSVVSNKTNLDQGEVNPINTDDAYYILEAARSVVIVPGYGMAVAQAQHIVRELSEILEDNGCDVKYAIHPVAGRMPGHMNVLLAEANISYDHLIEMDDINPTMGSVDVCLVIGANDVVNPSALDDESSSIYGMPIIEVTRAKTVFVLKRSMNPGFAGIQNPLFFKENTRMLFGDAKESLNGIVGEFKT